MLRDSCSWSLARGNAFCCTSKMEPESLLEALADFEKKSKKEVSSLLDQFLCHVAKTGETLIPWSQFKCYFVFKLEKVMDDFRASAPEPRAPPNPNVEYVPYEEMKDRILKIVNGFTGIPFTIQRLCELLTDPKKNYTGTDKFLRGIEKNVMVVSCVYPSTEKYNFGSNSLNRVNGIMLSGSHTGYTDRSNINGPGTPRPLSRSKVSLSSPLTTNGLLNSSDREINVQQTEDKSHSDSPTSHGEDTQSSCSKNKHLEDTMEAEAPEVKRLKFDKEDEEDELYILRVLQKCLKKVRMQGSRKKPKMQVNGLIQLTIREVASDNILWLLIICISTESSSVKMKALFESDQEKADVSFKNIKTSDENQMDQSDLTKTLTSEASEISGNTDTVSNSVDCSAAGKPDTPPETPEIASESPMENSADATEEPMEQD
ncbi:LOW QUALITY PROTEIN: serine/threonine-protein phosphatase 4 regulatory subunit 2-like [Pristis pectinata]|uniref:LOW QUALITY PROTEIN: serine/threonine-protein phosphatase 4 regulatory subunit 2-like n=1 Tax=Pristis pectinata TaxID=685728 RepID=UPI00223E1ECB|nr:LOW QUALITY PROTEIN: serine/threonine-protein phosphatase 4 regulatory subunit 2-like [Pristis pectinata]